MNTKIALGMSGGVDSSLSAHLLVEAGYDVTGVFLQCWRAPGCRADQDRQDALKVALSLGIKFEVLDFVDAYKQKVVDHFFADYEQGLTPNPDVWCNTAIKFGLFYDWALANGFDGVATGHYARVGEVSPLAGSTRQVKLLTLQRGLDRKKDQTYFLYKTRQDQLAHILFPIGHLTKDQVRAEAQKRNIPVANKPDSQGICFIGDINVRDFLREHLGEKPGDVLDTQGNVIGRHQGVWFYTIGQRHGFELLPKVRLANKQWKHVLPPLYVVSKDAAANTITVGFGAETLRQEVAVGDVFWRTPELIPPGENKRLFVRVRHGGALLPATLVVGDPNQDQPEPILRYILRFDQPQRGLASGQAAVFYEWWEQWQNERQNDSRTQSQNDWQPQQSPEKLPDLAAMVQQSEVCLGGAVMG